MASGVLQLASRVQTLFVSALLAFAAATTSTTASSCSAAAASASSLLTLATCVGLIPVGFEHLAVQFDVAFFPAHEAFSPLVSALVLAKVRALRAPLADSAGWP